MHFDRRDFDRGQSITNGNTCMRVSRRIDQNTDDVVLGSLTNHIHDVSFMVGLQDLNFNTFGRGKRLKPGVDLIESDLAVYLRLSLTEQIKIRAVDD